METVIGFFIISSHFWRSSRWNNWETVIFFRTFQLPEIDVRLVLHSYRIRVHSWVRHSGRWDSQSRTGISHNRIFPRNYTFIYYYYKIILAGMESVGGSTTLRTISGTRLIANCWVNEIAHGHLCNFFNISWTTDLTCLCHKVSKMLR